LHLSPQQHKVTKAQSKKKIAFNMSTIGDQTRNAGDSQGHGHGQAQAEAQAEVVVVDVDISNQTVDTADTTTNTPSTTTMNLLNNQQQQPTPTPTPVQKRTQPPRRQESSFYDKWTFSYMNPVIKRGKLGELFPDQDFMKIE
jgi:hypothetical protein